MHGPEPRSAGAQRLPSPYEHIEVPACASPRSPPRGSPSRPPATAARGLVVQQLCDGLTARGHELVLYASGDSHTEAELRSVFPEQMPGCLGESSYDARHMSFAFADIERDRFDLVHDHLGFLGIAFTPYLETPMVHTVHCAFDETAYPFYEQFRSAVGYVAISKHQQSTAPPSHGLGRSRLQRARP